MDQPDRIETGPRGLGLRHLVCDACGTAFALPTRPAACPDCGAADLRGIADDGPAALAAFLGVASGPDEDADGDDPDGDDPDGDADGDDPDGDADGDGPGGDVGPDAH